MSFLVNKNKLTITHAIAINISKWLFFSLAKGAARLAFFTENEILFVSLASQIRILKKFN